MTEGPAARVSRYLDATTVDPRKVIDVMNTDPTGEVQLRRADLQALVQMASALAFAAPQGHDAIERQFKETS